MIGLVFKCQKRQTSAAAESAPCAHFQKLDVGINQFFSNLDCVFSLGFFGCFFMVKSNNKVFKNSKKNGKKNKNKKIILRKNIYMYAGAPKFAQEFFFWSYHLRVCSSNYRKYFVVEEHWYGQLYSSDRRTDGLYCLLFTVYFIGMISQTLKGDIMTMAFI